MNSGIDIYSDKIEYKTIQAGSLFSYGQGEGLDKIVNTHLQQGWKLYGDMKVIDTGYISSSTHQFAFYQTLIRKLPAKGGRRDSSVRTRKAKLKSNPPHKRH
jgi:hypothetical protein